MEPDYVDPYLLRWPVAETRSESWQALESPHSEKLVRSIRDSNFLVRHLEELLEYAGIVPAVHQIEDLPFGFDPNLRDFRRLQGIAIQAYGPLVRAQRLDEPVVLQLAEMYEKSAAQILLRWSLQYGIIVLPESVRRERIEASADIFDFELSPDENARPDALNEGLHTCRDPRNADRVLNASSL